MPLILNIPPSDLETKMAAKAFVENVEKAKNATNSGLVGASFVLQALVSAGRGDIARANPPGMSTQWWRPILQPIRFHAPCHFS